MTSLRPVRVLVADGHEFVRAGLAHTIRRFRPHWLVSGMAEDGKQALEMAERLRPDLLIIDLALAEMNGLSVLERLCSTCPHTRVMILTVHPSAQLIRASRRLGASAYVSKSEMPSELVVAMDRILAGGPFFLSSKFQPEHATVGSLTHALPCQFLLTGRELEVLKQLATGATNKDTARVLGMSVRTAESHRSAILHKLGAASIGDLVRIALRDGLI